MRSHGAWIQVLKMSQGDAPLVVARNPYRFAVFFLERNCKRKNFRFFKLFDRLHFKSSLSSPILFANWARAFSIGSGDSMLTPASRNVSIGNFEPPALRNSK